MMNFERIITCIDAHCAGEPVRVITSGFPPIHGKTILEKREYVLKHYDHLRKLIMLEPRGHSGMYGCILVSPVTPDGDFGVLFTHNEGLSTGCGHATIGVTKVAIETGIINSKEGENIVKIDTPSGRVTSYAQVERGRVKSVRFQNVPSFVLYENIPIKIQGEKEIKVDIAFCGAFYAYVEAEKLGLKVDAKIINHLVDLGMKIKYKVIETMKVVHPLEKDLNSIYGTIFTSPLEKKGNNIISKNVCIFADGQIDRSPTGTGTGGRIALLSHKGLLKKGMTLINKSIIDTVFEGTIVDFTEVENIPAVIPEVSGNAHITGFNQLVLEPEDTLPEGFRLIGG
jgi:proline racemase